MPSIPDITVVIPTRGRPALLRRAILSVLNQTLRSLELIIVLDGDDLETTSTVAAFADPRIFLIVLPEPVGGSEARNVGVRSATGRYIALLDDDDEWLSSKLQAQIALANAHPGTTFVVVTEYIYRADGQPDEIWPGHLPTPGEPLSDFVFSSRGGFQTSTYLCPRELFLRVPFVRGLKKHQDWDWFLRLVALPGFELLVVPLPLSIYNVPDRTRASISGQLDWQFSHQWAVSNFSLMTRKAYASFLVKICVRSAATQRAGTLVYLRLLRDLLTKGQPTPRLILEFFVSIVLPGTLRSFLRARLESLRAARLTFATDRTP